VELTGPEPSVEHFQLSLRTEQFYLGEIESHPEEISNYTELAHLYLLNDDVDKAIDVFRKAILAGTAQGADRNDVRYLYKTLTSAYRGNYSKGDREKEKQTHDKLEVIVEEAIEKAPRDSGEYRSLAMVYTSLVPLEKIAALCDRIAQGNPDSTIYQDMGDIYLERGKAADAIVMFEQAITRGPDNFKTRYALATAYHRVGRYEKAQQQYEAAQAIDAPPREKAELLFMFSRLHRKTGDLEKAEQALRSATELAPDSDQSGRWALQLVDVLIEQKKFNEAEKMCTDLAAAGKNPYLKRRAQQRLQRITNERRNEGK